VDAFMSKISAKQALEWELYILKNPSLDEIMPVQIAYIAQLFASTTIKKEDGTKFSLQDFMPWVKKKVPKVNLVDSLKELVRTIGDDKAKAWAGIPQERPKVLGTDGKLYNYALEEFAKRTKPPRRLTKEYPASLQQPKRTS
jgi:hypothetical protein